MDLKKVTEEKELAMIDAVSAVAERIRKLETGREEFLRKDAELNRLIDEAWKKGGSAGEESPFPPNPPK